MHSRWNIQGSHRFNYCARFFLSRPEPILLVFLEIHPYTSNIANSTLGPTGRSQQTCFNYFKNNKPNNGKKRWQHRNNSILNISMLSMKLPLWKKARVQVNKHCEFDAWTISKIGPAGLNFCHISQPHKAVSTTLITTRHDADATSTPQQLPAPAL